MNQKSIKTLEFDKVRAHLVELCTSAGGKRHAEALVPYDHVQLIERAQDETADAVSRILSKGNLSFYGVQDVKEDLSKARKGGSLSAMSLMQIATLIEAADRARIFGSSEIGTEDDSLSDRFSCLSPDIGAAKEIRRCILDEETIADDASGELKAIRRKLALSSERIRSAMQSFINGPAKTYLMDSIITTRDNRYCVPVKAEHKSQVPGIVHALSSTGSTLFIEPQSVVNLNNEIRELELDEIKEIQRILGVLSERVGTSSEQTKADYEILIELDFIFAKARLALEMDAMRPEFNTGEIIELHSARHPLIDKERVVPIDIRLGESYDLLIITGPNTGGKTVSLKTVGLLELMGMSGLHIPAKEGTKLSYFRDIYADIGDEQSIEQSLSTFSSHMTNIVSILKSANITCLCLFDELCAGTDPTEGAALAIAVLANLHKKSIRTIATTHYSELKEYALTTPWVENASCEFNVETLSPTYRILIGVPGKSNAFAISKRLGLPGFIIKDAESRIGDEEKNLEKLMASLEEGRQELEQKQREAERREAELNRLQKRIESEKSKLDVSREKILEKAKSQAQGILEEAKSTADETIRRMQKYQVGGDIREAERDRTHVRERLNSVKESRKSELTIESAPSAPRLNKKDVRVGLRVHVRSLDLSGTLLSLPDSSGKVFVQCGIMKYETKVDDLFSEETKKTYAAGNKDGGTGKKPNKDAGLLTGLSNAMTISTELMLIGLTADEARQRLSEYLDDAYLSRLETVRIVHGKGSGVLRKMVQDYCRKCKYIDSYRLGEYGEGDAGVTIVTFKAL